MSSIDFFPLSWRLDENYEKLSIFGISDEGTLYLELPFRPWITIKYDYTPENLLCLAPISDMIPEKERWTVVCDNKNSLNDTIKVLRSLDIDILDLETEQLSKFLHKKKILSHASLRATGLNPLPLYQLYGKKTSTCDHEFSILDIDNSSFVRKDDMTIFFNLEIQKDSVISIEITEITSLYNRKSSLYHSDEKGLLKNFFDLIRNKDPTLCISSSGQWEFLNRVTRKLFHNDPINFSRLVSYQALDIRDCPGRICISMDEVYKKIYPQSYEIGNFDSSLIPKIYEIASFWYEDAQFVYNHDFKRLCRNLAPMFYKGHIDTHPNDWKDYRKQGTFSNVTERSTDDLFKSIITSNGGLGDLVRYFDIYPGLGSGYPILAMSSLFRIDDIYTKAKVLYPRNQIIYISVDNIYTLQDKKGDIDLLINHRNGTLIEKERKRYTFGYSPLLNSCIGLIQKALNLYISMKLKDPLSIITPEKLFNTSEQYIEDYLLNIVLNEDDFVNVSGPIDLSHLSPIKNLKRSLARRILSIGKVRPSEMTVRYLLVEDIGTLLEQEIDLNPLISLSKDKYKKLYYGAIGDLV